MVNIILLFECWCGLGGLILLLSSGGCVEVMVRCTIPPAGNEQVSIILLSCSQVPLCAATFARSYLGHTTLKLVSLVLCKSGRTELSYIKYY